MQDFGFWLEQLQQHRLYQQNLQQEQTEQPSIIQLSGKVTSSDTSTLPLGQRVHISPPPYSPSIGQSTKEEGMS
jgi:hypothetical protein